MSEYCIFCTSKMKEIGNLNEKVEAYRATIEEAFQLICGELGVETDYYDRDQSDFACYLDCFKDAAAVIQQSGIRWNEEEGDFIKQD